jgi:hypothetical protein
MPRMVLVGSREEEKSPMPMSVVCMSVMHSARAWLRAWLRRRLSLRFGKDRGKGARWR